ncbi:hypothetical protein BBJ28_00003352 [Nothophytophthora sp. Chile5]|nr:hypothetical protein BBJ28_00003352 [Nothophytophthora sp. Chile5]
MEEDAIVAQINDLPLHKSEEELRALLGEHHAKQLRSACTKLHLKAQTRSSTKDNKPGYIDLLWGYYKAKCDAVLGALEGPRITAAEGDRRPTRHCAFRLLNVIFSDAFVARMGEADPTPERQLLDERAVNENSPYWSDITKVFNEDTAHHNGFVVDREDSLYSGVEPALAVPHSSYKLQDMWKKTVARYDKALRRSKRSGSHGDFWNFCEGHMDALYLHDWLQVLSDGRDTALGLIPVNARMSTLPRGQGNASVRSSQAASDERPGKRRRLTTAERIAEVLERDREDDLEERKREREEAAEGRNFEVVTRASTAVQAAMATLEVLRKRNTNKAQVQAAQLVVNKLIARWTQTMEKASDV